MNFLQWFMPSYDVKNPGVKEVPKIKESDIDPKLTYYYVKGKPLSYLEVDQNTKYFEWKLDLVVYKLNKILKELERLT